MLIGPVKSLVGIGRQWRPNFRGHRLNIFDFGFQMITHELVQLGLVYQLCWLVQPGDCLGLEWLVMSRAWLGLAVSDHDLLSEVIGCRLGHQQPSLLGIFYRPSWVTSYPIQNSDFWTLIPKGTQNLTFWYNVNALQNIFPVTKLIVARVVWPLVFNCDDQLWKTQSIMKKDKSFLPPVPTHTIL